MVTWLFKFSQLNFWLSKLQQLDNSNSDNSNFENSNSEKTTNIEKPYNKNLFLLFNYLLNIILLLTTFVFIFESKFILWANRKKLMLLKL